MTRKLEDVLRRRRLHNTTQQRLIMCYDEIHQMQDKARALGYALTSTELPEEAHCLSQFSDDLFDSLQELKAEIRLLIKLGGKP